MAKLKDQFEWKLVSEAEFGAFYYYAKITKKKSIELINQGFEVTDSKNARNYPRLHRIYWGNALKLEENQNIRMLNENDPKYTFPERLWIISTKSLQDPAYYFLHN